VPDAPSATTAGGPTVHEAVLAGRIKDPARPGAVITSALCGHWHHDGPCRWPHHTEAIATAEGLVVRTVFVAPAEEQHEVTGRMAAALGDAGGWQLSSAALVGLRPDERALWARLSAPR
jgi:hypothetical protein